MRIFWWLFTLLLFSGCTHWRHTPAVPLDQHRADLKHCLGEARGGGVSLVVPVVGVTPVNTAVAGLGFAATIAEEVNFERRLVACMGQRGYRRDGRTTNIYGWTGQ